MPNRDPRLTRKQIQQRGREPVPPPASRAPAKRVAPPKIDGLLRARADDRLPLTERKRAVRRELNLTGERAATVAAALAQLDVAAAHFEQIAPTLLLALPSEWVQQFAETIYGMLAERFEQAYSGATPKYLTTDEAAEYLRASKQRIYDLVSSGRIKPRKEGTRNLFDRDELDAYLRGDRRR